jgi:hypothetical protein
MSNVDYNIKMVEPSKKFSLALKSQNFIPLKMEAKRSFVEPDKTIFVLNAAEQTNIERNQSTKYRINGKLNIITDNTIIQGFGSIVPNSAWSPEPVDNKQNPSNWVLQISYPSEKDEDKTIYENGVNTKSIEGFRIKEILPYSFRSGTTQILIRTSQKHGITDLDDFLYLRPLNNFINDGVDTYNYLGYQRIVDFEPGNEDYGLILDTEYTVPTTTQFNPTTGFDEPITLSDFIATGKRVFDSSSEDFVFANNVEINSIQNCDSNGEQVGVINHLKIFSQSHDLRVNNFIDLRDTQINGINNIYKIVSTPTPNQFVIKYDYTNINNTLDVIQRNLRYRFCDGVPSEYYYRKFEIMTQPKDYEVYNAAFSTTIYTDNYINNNFLFHFNKDIDVGGLTDNLNRPLSELYLTTVKRASYFREDIAYSGYRFWTSTFQLLESNREITPLGGNDGQDNEQYILDTVSSVQGDDEDVAGTIKNEGNSYFGDFVEYNRAFLEERVLADVVGRFAPSQTILGGTEDVTSEEGDTTEENIYISGVSPDGYTYNLHQKIKIRDFSENIETVDNKENEIFPSYSQINNDGTVSWRDLLDIGFLEGSNDKIGVDYPFVNSRHYLFGNYPIYIRKQLPVSVTDVKVENDKFVQFNTDSTPNDEC